VKSPFHSFIVLKSSQHEIVTKQYHVWPQLVTQCTKWCLSFDHNLWTKEGSYKNLKCNDKGYFVPFSIMSFSYFCGIIVTRITAWQW